AGIGARIGLAIGFAVRLGMTPVFGRAWSRDAACASRVMARSPVAVAFVPGPRGTVGYCDSSEQALANSAIRGTAMMRFMFLFLEVFPVKRATRAYRVKSPTCESASAGKLGR